MIRDGHKDRGDRRTRASEPTEPIEGWLRYELQNLHKSVLDESLPPQLNELLARLEAELGSQKRPEPFRSDATERRTGKPFQPEEEG